MNSCTGIDIAASRSSRSQRATKSSSTRPYSRVRRQSSVSSSLSTVAFVTMDVREHHVEKPLSPSRARPDVTVMASIVSDRFVPS